MEPIDVVAVVGACVPERAAYAARLAERDGLELVTAAHLARSPDPVDEAAAVVPWYGGSRGVVLEYPTDAHVTEIIGSLTAPNQPARLVGVVCVADATHLLDDLRRDEYRLSARHWGDGPAQYVAEALLTVNQIEYASTVVLVNWEALPTPELSAVMALAGALSPRARIRLEPVDLRVPRDLVRAAPYAAQQDRPGWVALLNREHDPHMVDPRVGAFVLEHPRPLHPGRLQRVLDHRVDEGEFGTVVRSVGFCRLATRPETLAMWSHVGRMISLDPIGPVAPDPHDDVAIVSGFELAIVGMDVDRDGLAEALGWATLTDEEFLAGPEAWIGYNVPYPAWAPQRRGAE